MTIAEPIVSFPPIVTREEWETARAELLVKEKALTHHKDEVSALRRRLPMVEITMPYVFQGKHGPVTLLDLFEGRSQLIVQHFMFHPDWDEGCVGCSMLTDYLGPLGHLHARDTSLAIISRAPLDKLLAYRQRMGWSYPWVSSGDTTFNDDFGYTIDGEEVPGTSTFLREDDRVFHTWSTSGRGDEDVMSVFPLLDMTVRGRQETWEDSPAGWPQSPPFEWWKHHDRYEDVSETGSCCH